MFLVSDTSNSREQRIRQLLNEDPPLAALLSVIHFEWTLRRSIIALGTSPNVDVRKKLERCHGHKKYKQLWKDEVFPRVDRNLPEIIKNWDGLQKSFKLRHRLVHGIKSCGKGEYTQERVQWALDAAINVREFCIRYDVNLDSRLPIRRKLLEKKETDKLN